MYILYISNNIKKPAWLKGCLCGFLGGDFHFSELSDLSAVLLQSNSPVCQMLGRVSFVRFIANPKAVHARKCGGGSCPARFTMRSREFESYLPVNFALPLEKDVRLSGERKNVSYDWNGRWTGRKPRGSPLLDELAHQQECEENDSQAAQSEQRLRACHRHQGRRF